MALDIRFEGLVPIMTVTFPRAFTSQNIKHLKVLIQAATMPYGSLLPEERIVVFDTTPMSLMSAVTDLVSSNSLITREFTDLYALIFENVKRHVHSSLVIINSVMIQGVFNTIVAKKKEKSSHVCICASREAAAKMVQGIVPIVAARYGVA